MPRIVNVTAGDTAVIALRVVEAERTNISGYVFEVSLGTADAPGVWHTPDVRESINVYTARLKINVGAAGTIVPVVGSYWLWVRVKDVPQIESLRAETEQIKVI